MYIVHIFTPKIQHLASLLQWEKVARFTATDEVLPQYIAEINPISLCSHPDTHPTPTARFTIAQHGTAANPSRRGGRFEPVAVVMLRLGGSLAMFAPEGDDCLQRAKREDAGRFSKEGKSLDDFCRAFHQ